MDPTTTYREMFEAMQDGDHEVAREHATNLRSWLKGGGFYPQFSSKEEVDAYVADVLRRTEYVECDW